MSKKCCKKRPPCKDCPKLRKKKKSKLGGCGPVCGARENTLSHGKPEKSAKFEMRYFAPDDMSISGQRGWMAKAPAGLASVPACRRRQPARAIIAPLSVQNSSSG